MGITLHAIVESFRAERREYGSDGERTNAMWWELARWKFNKDYALMRALDKVCSDGWPSDSSVNWRNHPEDDLDTKQWCTAKDFIALADRIYAYDDEKDWEAKGRVCAYWVRNPQALGAALRVASGDGTHLRVLFGRC